MAMNDLNRVTLIGHLGRDPEIRMTQSGDRIASMTVATSERWKSKASGEWQEKTEWHRVVVFDQHIAARAEQHMRKGIKVFVEGQLETRKWQDKDGNDRFNTEIVIKKWGGQIIDLSPRQKSGGTDSAPRPYQAPKPDPMDLDDDVPW